MNYNDIKLPPLPAPISREVERQYSVQQLEAYAREAVRLNSCKAALTQQQAAEPVAWQFYQDGKWHNGMEINDHKQHTIAAGFPVRDLYAHTPAQPPAPEVDAR